MRFEAQCPWLVVRRLRAGVRTKSFGFRGLGFGGLGFRCLGFEVLDTENRGLGGAFESFGCSFGVCGPRAMYYPDSNTPLTPPPQHSGLFGHSCFVFWV